MGKYDLVESVLKDLGAEFYFDAVAIRPRQSPAVFRKNAKNTFVFGLPGNPVSTMVTFELFAVSRDRSAQRRHRARFTISRSTPGGTPE